MPATDAAAAAAAVKIPAGDEGDSRNDLIELGGATSTPWLRVVVVALSGAAVAAGARISPVASAGAAGDVGRDLAAASRLLVVVAGCCG